MTAWRSDWKQPPMGRTGRLRNAVTRIENPAEPLPPGTELFQLRQYRYRPGVWHGFARVRDGTRHVAIHEDAIEFDPESDDGR